MNRIFTIAVVLFSYGAVAQTYDSTKVNIRYQPSPGYPVMKPDTVLFDLESDKLFITTIDYFAGSKNGPVWAIWHFHNDTIMVRYKDESTRFNLDINISYSTFQIPLKSNQNPIIIKIDNKVYKINNLVTRLENTGTAKDLQAECYDKVLILSGNTNQEGSLKVVTLDGAQVINLDYLPESVSMDNLPPGIYLVTVSAGNTIIKRKIYIK